MLAAYVIVAGATIASTQSTFTGYASLILGAVLLAYLSESFRSFRVRDGVIERRSFGFTRRVPVDQISQAFLHNDGWGAGAVVIRGRRFADNVVVPVSALVHREDGAVQILGALRDAASRGADVDPAIFAV